MSVPCREIPQRICVAQMLLDLVPDLLVNNGFLFTGVNLVFIFDFADIGMIAQEPIYVGAIPNAAAGDPCVVKSEKE